MKRREVLKAAPALLASAFLMKPGISLSLYYSIVDWHHPNYPNQGRHHELPAPETGDDPNWDTP